ncbi:protein yippee-like 4 isoform X2 [Harpia harpyja]|uniref:protein yippee-like 4 isoform X2 n=1 Tax=Harpia harpyja TaxID=202280 RepID=UPI0022B09687|nr:protein yippee-like 4 isoform X2 [Harpia harpyja]
MSHVLPGQPWPCLPVQLRGERGLWPGGAAAAADGAALGGRHLLPELQDHPGLEIRECPRAQHPYPAAGAALGTLTPTVGTTRGTLSPPCGCCPRHPKSLVWAPQTCNVGTTLGTPNLCCGHQPGHPKAMVKPGPLGTPTPRPGQRRGTPSGGGGVSRCLPPGAGLREQPEVQGGEVHHRDVAHGEGERLGLRGTAGAPPPSSTPAPAGTCAGVLAVGAPPPSRLPSALRAPGASRCPPCGGRCPSPARGGCGGFSRAIKAFLF